jgi:two-component system, NtrC family, C4-dicarboxylate transport sensor histidine kinase DctB
VKRLVAYFAQHAFAAWVLIVGMALLGAAGVYWLDTEVRIQQRQTLLLHEAQRSGLELATTTLNGNLMGSVTLLGLLDADIKQEATNGLLSEDANISSTMAMVGNAYGAEGVFVVGMDGIVKSSWDRINKPSTGLDVRFRPYYQMAMRGQSSVYAAISMARGDRSLYFAAPVFPEHAQSTTGTGAVVARTSLARVDSLLNGKFDIALLLSPQGVVFAGNRTEWLDRLAGEATPQRLDAIRELRQFGAKFENQVPEALPLQPVQGVQKVDQHTYAVAMAPVHWNDPAGDWRLMVAEDLGRTAPAARSAGPVAAVTLVVVLLGWMWLRLVRSHQAQALASAQLQVYAQAQEQQARFRGQLGELSLRLQHSAGWAEFATHFFQAARNMLGVVQGTLYIAQGSSENQVLVLAGHAACAYAPPTVLQLGEGLLGQCALERTTRLIMTPPDGVWNVRSGLGGTPVAALVLAPLVVQDTMIGVVEMGLLASPEGQKQAFDELVFLLANHLEMHLGTLPLQTPVNPEHVEVQA